MTYTRPVFYYACGTTFLFTFFNIPFANLFPGGGSITVQGLNGQQFTYDGALINDPFPLLLDPTLWEYRRIPYPASVLDMGSSVLYGRDWVVNDILTNTSADQCIALGGYSQGAATAGAVYDSFRQGALAAHRHRLRAMITFGSPVRQKNHTWPGSSGWNGAFEISGSTRDSHGVFPYRLQNTEDFVWDFVMPRDPISNVGDSPDGILWSSASGLLLFGNVLGAGLALADLLFSSLIGLFVPGAGVIAQLAAILSTTGHVMYPTSPPPDANGNIPSSGDTCYQLAARYLNSVGQAVFDEKNPKVPAPTTSATYQWFTSLANG